MLKITTEAEKMEGHLAGFTISSLYIRENYPHHFFWKLKQKQNPKCTYPLIRMLLIQKNSGKADVKVLISQ